MSNTEPGKHDLSLRYLLSEVLRTRKIQSQRQGQRGVTAQALLTTRRAALRALEDYTAALRRRGWPTPPQMARDIQLLRALCGVDRSRGPRW